MLTVVNYNKVGYRMYGKLFEHMYDGTLATKGPWQALVTFQQFIILADKNGDVDMTPAAISRRTTIPLEIIDQGISVLEQADPESRSPTLEGRRIVRLSETRSWGWNVVNYNEYRKIRSEEERREYMRNYQRMRRAAVKQNVNMSTGGEQSQPIAVSSRQYAEADSKPKVAPLALPTWLPEDPWNAWLEVRTKKKVPNTKRALELAIGELEKLRDKGFDPRIVLENATLKGWRGIFAPATPTIPGQAPDYSSLMVEK